MYDGLKSMAETQDTPEGRLLSNFPIVTLTFFVNLAPSTLSSTFPSVQTCFSLCLVLTLFLYDFWFYSCYCFKQIVSQFLIP